MITRATLILAAAFTFALASANPPLQTDLLHLYANDIDGVITECPSIVRQAFYEPLCVESFGGSELARAQADGFMRRYTDLHWHAAWERDTVGSWVWYYRFFIMEPEYYVFAFTTWELEPYRSVSFLFQLGVDRE